MKLVAKNPFFFLVIAVVILGTNSVLLKLGSEDFPPLLFGALRYIIAGTLFMLIAYRQPFKDLTKFIPQISISTLLLIIVVVCWILGIHYSSAMNMSLFGLISPMLVYLGSILFLGEPRSNKGLIGSLIALCGSVVLIGAPLYENEGIVDKNLLGNSLLFISVIGLAAFLLHTKRLYKIATVEQINGFRLSMTGIVVLLISMLSGEFIDVGGVKSKTLIYLFLSGVVTGFIALYIFYTALKNVRAEDAAPIFYLDNLTGVVLGAVLLGESLGNLALVAAAIIIFGVIIAHPIHLHRFHYYLDPSRHTFEEFFHWMKNKYIDFEKAVKKII